MGSGGKVAKSSGHIRLTEKMPKKTRLVFPPGRDRRLRAPGTRDIIVALVITIDRKYNLKKTHLRYYRLADIIRQSGKLENV